MRLKSFITCLAFVVVLLQSCGRQLTRQEEMILYLDDFSRKFAVSENTFSPEARLPYLDSMLALTRGNDMKRNYKVQKANVLLQLGREAEAIDILSALSEQDSTFQYERTWKDLAIAYTRLGDRANCILNHAAESCILPIKGLGVHRDTIAIKKAIGIFNQLLLRNPADFESRWLFNLAYMSLGQYPKKVPAEFLIPDIARKRPTGISPFTDIAANLGLDVTSMAGGSIVDDFDNDGYLDVMISSWGLDEGLRYFRNNGAGGFEDRSTQLGLTGITGGLNIMQADYNNDGLKDVLVLRGAWKGVYGKEPNSLLRNNGDGSFTDVTIESGLLSFHPTQTATWNDFDNDGWLDLFIGNESSRGDFLNWHPCELYMNNHDGTFREIAEQAKCNVINFVKGVTSGDYDHDGLKDIFLSTMRGERLLLKNIGKKNGDEIAFQNVTTAAGLDQQHGNSFPTWFWDYDNDGWLDIFACDYSFNNSLGYFAAVEKLKIEKDKHETMLLYRNNHDGTFAEVSAEVGLKTTVFGMGSNFGDIDNDGFLDMYFGTGNPNLASVIPNKMFRNVGGKKFANVTASARVGHLQKGHAVSFGDMDNDGDQDIYIRMGGPYPGDAYPSALFMNPGQNKNHWICISLEGTKSNRSAIGSELKITIRENGVERSIYRDVNSGGSFGASPLRREIGIGSAESIDRIEIKWHGSGLTQVFNNVKPDQFIKITEGNGEIEVVNLRTIQWSLPDQLCYE